MAEWICCSGYDHKHHPVHGTNGRVRGLLEMADWMCCSGYDHKDHPVHGTNGRVCGLRDMVIWIRYSGYDHKHLPVHGMKTRVQRLLDMVIWIRCSGYDHKHRPVRGILKSVCTLLREDRKWTCSSALNYDALRCFAADQGIPVHSTLHSNRVLFRKKHKCKKKEDGFSLIIQ